MSEYTSRSQIERFRRRRHGPLSKFRFLSDGQEGYIILGEAETHFLVSRSFNSEIGAREESLSFDTPDDWNPLIFPLTVWGDLVTLDTNGAEVSRRFRLSADTLPNPPENRARFVLTAAFNDKTPIFGLESPFPPMDYQFVIGETPAGAVNGSNATFSTEFNFIPETVQVMVNGLDQKRSQDFVTSGTHTITLSISPQTGDTVLVHYIRSS